MHIFVHTHLQIHIYRCICVEGNILTYMFKYIVLMEHISSQLSSEDVAKGSLLMNTPMSVKFSPDGEIYVHFYVYIHFSCLYVYIQ